MFNLLCKRYPVLSALAERESINLQHQKYALPHIFDRVCHENHVEHRLTLPAHPWTNGQVERMNKTIKEATVKRYYYNSHQQLREHLKTFIDAYNYAKRLNALKGSTPYEFIVKTWEIDPQRFYKEPIPHNMGLYT
jgi:transposase InsO family protein